MLLDVCFLLALNLISGTICYLNPMFGMIKLPSFRMMILKQFINMNMRIVLRMPCLTGHLQPLDFLLWIGLWGLIMVLMVGNCDLNGH